jgi:hypothetical protein
MATASARKYRDLLVTASLRICADHDFVSEQTGRARVEHGQTLHHFFHDIFGTVNELFHDKANVQRRVAVPIFLAVISQESNASLYRSKLAGFGVKLANL